MPAKFEPNHAGLREYMMSGDLYPALEPQASAIAGRARANAAPHHRTGAYEESIHLEREISSDRVRIRVVADDPIAEILEARYHVLSRAVTGS